jgi:hypothetical protein
MLNFLSDEEAWNFLYPYHHYFTSQRDNQEYRYNKSPMRTRAKGIVMKAQGVMPGGLPATVRFCIGVLLAIAAFVGSGVYVGI